MHLPNWRVRVCILQKASLQLKGSGRLRRFRKKHSAPSPAKIHLRFGSISGPGLPPPPPASTAFPGLCFAIPPTQAAQKAASTPAGPLLTLEAAEESHTDNPSCLASTLPLISLFDFISS